MNNKIVVTRVFNAPVESVWKTWTDAELVKRWWGPEHFTSPSAKIDFREGGTSIVSMRAPENSGGQDMYSIWSYTKIIPMQSIEFIQNLSDKHGTKMKPASLGMPPDFPEDIRTKVTFKEPGDNRTEMTVTEFADMGQMTEFAIKGLNQSLDKMSAIFNMS